MLMIRKLCTCIFLILELISLCYSECVKTSKCECVKDDGWGFDLSTLTVNGPVTSKDGNFVFNPCQDVDLNFIDTSEKGCNSTVLCWKNGNTSLSLGTYDKAHWELIQGRTNLRLTLINNFGKGTFVDLDCCQDSCETTLDASQFKTQKKIKITSPVNCQKNIQYKNELSTGSILLILLIVFMGLYLIIGVLALKYFQGAVGWELIPNHDFWTNLPGLVRVTRNIIF
ncbi:hypothetical protein HCN44_003770 [Aphidius gifuensis]|uniref:Uncharacterized protein n=1 Tax=Aphidius gifuensis TaxID=684658 RepID=A0A834XLR7_APHGI|nr:hypothetical protein HCN44_003770 [Aphidius gifuensis]